MSWPCQPFPFKPPGEIRHPLATQEPTICNTVEGDPVRSRRRLLIVPVCGPPQIPSRPRQYLELHKSQAEALVTSYCKPVMRSSSRRKGSEVGQVRHAIPRIVLDPLPVRRLMEPLPTLQRRGSFLRQASSSEDQNGSTTPLDSGASDRPLLSRPVRSLTPSTHHIGFMFAHPHPPHTHTPTADTLIRTLDAMTYGSPCERLALPSTDPAVNQRRMPATGGFHMAHHHKRQICPA